MRVSTLRIPCDSLAAAAEFYSGVLDRDVAFGSIDAGYIGFLLDNAQVLLEASEVDEFESGRYLGFSIEVDNINEFYERCLARKVSFSGPPTDQPWGGRMTHVTDPSGNIFSIVQTMPA